MVNCWGFWNMWRNPFDLKLFLRLKTHCRINIIWLYSWISWISLLLHILIFHWIFLDLGELLHIFVLHDILHATYSRCVDPVTLNLPPPNRLLSLCLSSLYLSSTWYHPAAPLPLPSLSVCHAYKIIMLQTKTWPQSLFLSRKETKYLLWMKLLSQPRVYFGNNLHKEKSFQSC